MFLFKKEIITEYIEEIIFSASFTHNPLLCSVILFNKE